MNTFGADTDEDVTDWGQVTLEERGPRSTRFPPRETEDYFLSNAVWENSHGSFQPETGVRRRKPDGTWGEFFLIEHGWLDFETANDIILRALRKGWDNCRIGDFMQKLKLRRRPRGRVL
jgi:hypothetical protein